MVESGGFFSNFLQKPLFLVRNISGTNIFLPSSCIFLSKTIVIQEKSRKFARLKIEQHYSPQLRGKRRGDKNSQTIDYQEKRRIRTPHKRTH